MKGKKYIKNIVRNGFLYILLFVTLNFLYGFTQSLSAFFLGIITITLGYAPAYFLNDYTDRVGDKQQNRGNLYNDIHNHTIFLFLAIFCTAIGLLFSFFISFQAFILLIFLYLLNIFYSVEPFHLRNRYGVREATIFVINIVKWYYVIFLMRFNPLDSPMPIMILAASSFAALTSLYKRHIDKRSTLPIFCFFTTIAFFSWGVSLFLYRKMFFFFVPLFPMLIFLYFRYKNKPTPNGVLISLYIVYFALVVFLTKYIFN